MLMSTLFSFLETCATQEQMDAALRTVTPDIAAIVNVASPAVAYSFELPLTGFVRRQPDDDGMIAATNHFVDPSWGIPPPEPDSENAWTALRRSNLLAFAGANKGAFDVAKVAHVMATAIAEGGVFDAGTIYQVVVVPADLTITLRAPNHFDWQEIDLKHFFY